jgi:hypothetical protein
MLPSTLIGKEIIARPDAQVCRAPGIRRGNDIYVLVLVKGLWAGEGLAQSKSIKNTIVEQHPSRGNNNTTEGHSGADPRWSLKTYQSHNAYPVP